MVLLHTFLCVQKVILELFLNINVDDLLHRLYSEEYILQVNG